MEKVSDLFHVFSGQRREVAGEWPISAHDKGNLPQINSKAVQVEMKPWVNHHK